VQVRAHALFSKCSPVQEDWSAWLPAAKAEAFDACVRELERSYSMFSVSLNEALEFRRIGKAVHSCRAIFVIPALCARLAFPLEGVLRTLGEHAKHFGIVPNIAPLEASNFRGFREQRAARMSDLLSHVLLTQRSQFFHKIETLEDIVLGIRENFQEIASDLGSGTSGEPSEDWQAIDDAHFDLNTCLREAIVLLKSFLVVLPNEQLSLFQKSINVRLLARYDQPPAGRRRIVLIERE
jgi:hypothetical protein